MDRPHLILQILDHLLFFREQEGGPLCRNNGLCGGSRLSLSLPRPLPRTLARLVAVQEFGFRRLVTAWLGFMALGLRLKV